MTFLECPSNAQTAFVKSVVSGDTVVLRGRPQNGPPKEKIFSLAGVTAPRLGRKANADGSGATEDEPWAWQSREYLRKKIIGMEVKFSVEYQVPSGREFGQLWVGKENVAKYMISGGFLKLRESSGKGEKAQYLPELEEIQKQAESSEIGMFTSDANKKKKALRKIEWVLPDSRQFLEKNKGKQLNAIVEHVRDGSSFRVFLLPGYQFISINLSGVKCPAFSAKKSPENPALVDENPAVAGEPFAQEALYFSESRLLQRDVKVILEGVSGNSFVGTILHPAGNISELLLSEGLAKCVDWTMSMVSVGREKYRAAEKSAKLRQIRLWKSFVSAEAGSGKGVGSVGKEFKGTVVEISTPECLVVKPHGSETYQKIFLSSIRSPRLVNPTGSAKSEPESADKDKKGADRKGLMSERPLYSVPFYFEAREFLRKRLIGKKVSIRTDYVKEASEGYPEKVCATVSVESVNIGEALVSKGFATVVRHRSDDEQRSSVYDDLLVAESRAVQAKKGLHGGAAGGGGSGGAYRISDISNDSTKAKQFFPFLKRAGKIMGIVEFVSAGSRFKIHLPKDSCVITFLLGGILCPRVGRISAGGVEEGGEPFGKEAYDYAYERVFQRDVEIDVESMDKNGNFVGTLWMDGVNLNVALVKVGLASVHFSADRFSYSRELYEVEEEAKKNAAGLWKEEENWAKGRRRPGVHEEVGVDEEKEDISERKIEYEEVVVVEVGVSEGSEEEPFHFWYQKIGGGVQKGSESLSGKSKAVVANPLETLMNSLDAYYESHPPLEGSYSPKVGDLCAALFSLDRRWYRARVTRVISRDSVRIFYVDFGNSEEVSVGGLTSLPHEFTQLSPQAFCGQLACVQPPLDEDWRAVSGKYFREMVIDAKFLLNVEYKNLSGRNCVTLVGSSSMKDVGGILLSQGLAFVEKRREKKLQKLLSEYKRFQDDAIKSRLHMWEYGDVRLDEEEEAGWRKSSADAWKKK